MITPAALAKSGSEESQQTAFFAWAADQHHLPVLKLMFHIPNGGLRNKATAGKLKASGVKAGVWDVFLPLPCYGRMGLFIEFKKRPNKLTDEQMVFGSEMLKMGYVCAVCWTWEEARDRVLGYLEGKI